MLAIPTGAAGQRAVASLPCAEGDPGHEIRGFVADLLSGVPLGGSTVLLVDSDVIPPELWGATETGAEGDFVFCSEQMPGESWALVAELGELTSRAVPLPEHSATDTLYIRWSEPAELFGRVTRIEDGTPVEGARITLEGRPVRALTDASGSFRLRGIGGGRLVLTTSGLGLQPRTDSVLVEPGGTLSVEVRLSAEPIELPPLSVSVGPRSEIDGVRTFGISPARVEELLPVAPDVAALLSFSNTPGLRAEGGLGSSGVCVEFLRRVQSSCAMARVMVNGAPVGDASGYLGSLPVSAIREVRIYPPFEAQFRFGPQGRNGVIDITLK